MNARILISCFLAAAIALQAETVADMNVQRTVRVGTHSTGTITPSQITSNQNDYSPTDNATAAVLRLSTDASRNITGLANGVGGRLVLVDNVGSFPIVLKDDDAASTAANRFALDADYTIAATTSVLLRYDATASRWRLTGLTSAMLSGTYQGLDPTLTALAGVTTAANKLIYATGSDAFATTDLTAFGRAQLGISSLTSTALLLGAGSSAITASDITYSTPTLTVPSGFTLSGSASQFTTASNKSVGTYTPSTSAIADFSSGGIGWRFTRPDDGTYIHAIYSYNTSGGALNNLVISSRSDLVFTTAAGIDTATEKMRLKSTGNLLIGGTTDISGSGGLKLYGTTEATTGGAGSFITDGGIYAAKKIVVGSTTASTGTTSGAFIVAGGGGFAGNVNIGGIFSINGYNAARLFNITGDSSVYDFFAFSDTRTSFVRTWLWGPGTGVSHGVGFRDSTGSTNVLALFDGAATNPYQVRALSTTDATTGGAGAFATDGGIYAAKKIITATTFTSAAGVAWDFGAASATSPTSPNRTVAVIVAGTTLYLHAKTTND